ncbi:MAG: AAA family ATPase [Chthoniobacteraceae bacterium]
MSQFDEHNPSDSAKAGSKLNGALYPIHEVCRMTGIEPSRIRFIETEFEEYFGDAGKGMQTTKFDQRGVDLLKKINQMLFKQGESPFDIRRKLDRDLHRLKIIAVTSGKGGVGKTTLSLNLSIAMEKRGLRTLLIDADMGLGNVHVFGGITPRGSMLDLIEERSGDAILSSGPGGIQVLCGCSGNAAMADLPPHELERLAKGLVALGDSFDVMIIDTGAGISAQVTHFLAMADDIIVVTTPNIAATLDAYGVIKVAREEAMRGDIHLVVNQADDEEQAHMVYEKIRLCSERFLQYSPGNLGGMVRDPVVEQSNQSRNPLLLSQPGHRNAKVILEIAESLGAPAPVAAIEESVKTNFKGTTAPAAA